MAMIIEDEIICEEKDVKHLCIIKFGREAYINFKDKPIGKVWIYTDTVENLKDKKYIIINSTITYI